MDIIIMGEIKCKCGWQGYETECETKTFGAYCGNKNESPELWGWEEWTNLACPKCESEIE